MGLGSNHYPFEVAVRSRILVALFIAGSAISLISCGGGVKASDVNDEDLVSRTVDSMEIVATDNGKIAYLLRAPLMEDHAFAREAYTEYRQGIVYVAYNDSTGMQSMHVVSDYALHWTNRDLYDLKGNVVAIGEEGQRLYTQQLMWNRKARKIYSNVDSKIEDSDGGVYFVEGFEADEGFGNMTWRKIKGTVSVDVEPATDSIAP